MVSNGHWRGRDLKSLIAQNGAAIMGIELYRNLVQISLC